MTSSRFPYEVLASVQRRRRSAAVLVRRRKPKLLEEPLSSGSQIVVATTALTSRILELHHRPDELKLLDRRLFEEVVAEVLDGFGYLVEVTAQTRDGGRDIIAISQRDQIQTKYLVECKRPNPSNTIGVGIVRQLLGVVEDERATKGILVATTSFSADARMLQERNEWRLELKDFDRLLEWIAKYVEIKGA